MAERPSSVDGGSQLNREAFAQPLLDPLGAVAQRLGQFVAAVQHSTGPMQQIVRTHLRCVHGAVMQHLAGGQHSHPVPTGQQGSSGTHFVWSGQQKAIHLLPQPEWAPVLASIHMPSTFDRQQQQAQQQQQQLDEQGAILLNGHLGDHSWHAGHTGSSSGSSGLLSGQQAAAASIASAGERSGSYSSTQPLFEVCMAKDEVKARLAPIPVYTVANPKNEFVLVAGENNTQLGFFFFKREDAEAIVEKIREENPRLARDSKILRVTMDNVYEVFTTPRDQTGLQGIHFRFMPDMKQVVHALALYKDAGLPTRFFTGVPVFQAEGLTVTTQEMQYVPLFLNKEDLDVAVQSAYKQRNAAQIQVYKDKAAKYEEEFNQVAVQANSAQGKEKVALEARARKAKAKLDAARDKAQAVERAPLPKVEVGSFEEVMQRMTESSGQELAAWSQVMFVAPGLLTTQGGALSSK